MTSSVHPIGFRLWLDAHCDARAWPFKRSWREMLAELPEELPGAVDDFDVFLPDDHTNYTHGALPRQHASARMEMAVYRDVDALVVIQRLWDGPKLPWRVAPPNAAGANILLMADVEQDQALYVGLDPQGNSMTTLMTGVRPDCSEDPFAHRPGPAGVETAAMKMQGAWVAGYRVPFACVPGVSSAPDALAFTAGRLLGETFEPIAWASPLVWAPMLSLMGTLHVRPRALPPRPRLDRVDLLYGPDREEGELVFRVRGTGPGERVPMRVTINTHRTEHECADGEVRQRWVPEDGGNTISVKVGGARSVRIDFEKWSGRQLFMPYGSGRPLPELDELRARFREWHEGQERSYVAPGLWCSGSYDPNARYGYDHNCAFPMEPYALACLYVAREEVYVQRVRESCDRIVAGIQPEGWIPCYHFGATPQPFEGGAFGHGSAGEALCLGYRVLGDARYLDAARRTADAYRLYRLENNTNYMAFVLWHLSELFELTGEPRYLDVAAWYAEHGVLRGLTPAGAFPGHNYYTAYGNITLKGMAKLLRVLPDGHPLKPRLRENTLRFANQILSRQRPNGLFEGRNRMYFGYQHAVPGLFEVAFAFDGEIARTLEPSFCAMYYARTAAQTRHEPEGLVTGQMGRYRQFRNQVR